MREGSRRERGVVFDIPAQDVGVVFKLPARRGKGIPQGDVDVLVLRLGFEVLFPCGLVALGHSAVQGGLAIDDDFGTGDAEVDVDMEASAALVVQMGRLNHDVATGDAAVALLQGADFFMDAGLDGG